jgi:hypothetical protein
MAERKRDQQNTNEHRKEQEKSADNKLEHDDLISGLDR